MKTLLSALLLVSMPALAGPLTVSDAWFRSLPAGLPAAGYFSAVNTTRGELAITGASSAGCGMLMLHHSSDKGGMSSMDMVDKVAVPAGGTVKFAPGGYHLMCTDPQLKIGAKMPVTLQLSDGSRAVVAFTVKNASGK